MLFHDGKQVNNARHNNSNLKVKSNYFIKIQAYNSERSVESFSAFIDENVRKNEAPTEPISYQLNEETDVKLKGKEGVVELNNKNINLAFKIPGFIFIKFYAPWCRYLYLL